MPKSIKNRYSKKRKKNFKKSYRKKTLKRKKTRSKMRGGSQFSDNEGPSSYEDERPPGLTSQLFKFVCDASKACIKTLIGTKAPTQPTKKFRKKVKDLGEKPVSNHKSYGVDLNTVSLGKRIIKTEHEPRYKLSIPGKLLPSHNFNLSHNSEACGGLTYNDYTNCGYEPFNSYYFYSLGSGRFVCFPEYQELIRDILNLLPDTKASINNGRVIRDGREVSESVEAYNKIIDEYHYLLTFNLDKNPYCANKENVCITRESIPRIRVFSPEKILSPPINLLSIDQLPR